eukprot:3249798-Prymnesium_polylepis.1
MTRRLRAGRTHLDQQLADFELPPDSRLRQRRVPLRIRRVDLGADQRRAEALVHPVGHRLQTDLHLA